MKTIYSLPLLALAIIVGEEWLSLFALIVFFLCGMYEAALRIVEELEAKKHVDNDY